MNALYCNGFVRARDFDPRMRMMLLSMILEAVYDCSYQSKRFWSL